MQEDECVLSEVHVGRHVACSSQNDSIQYEYSAGKMRLTVTSSRFPFQWPLSTQALPLVDQPEDTVNDEMSAEPDEDGDMVVKRRSDPAPFSLIIEHSMASPLPLVGLQVWAGALLMCDYVLHNRQWISDKVVLELGAGTGICSIVAAMFARNVICTDYDHRVLRLCQRNVSRNAELIRRCSSLFRPSGIEPGFSPVAVKELNWQLADPFVRDNCEKVKEQNEFRCWTEEDRQGIEVILAADVIYENELTDYLFGLLEKLLGEPPKKTVFIAVERRLNFTLEKLDVSCPAHEHFLRHLANPGIGFARVQQIPTDFPQYFNYERNKYLELWEISS